MYNNSAGFLFNFGFLGYYFLIESRKDGDSHVVYSSNGNLMKEDMINFLGHVKSTPSRIVVNSNFYLLVRNLRCQLLAMTFAFGLSFFFLYDSVISKKCF